MDDVEDESFSTRRLRAWYGSGEGRDIDALVHYRDRHATRLWHAALYGWYTAVRWLLDRGANVEGDGFGWAPLHCAARGGHRDVAVLLLDAGARVDAPDLQSRTALHLAASDGRREMCKLLVSRGASLDAIAREGNAEAYSRFHNQLTTADFLAAVRAAGGWAAYVQVPRTQLLALRRELPALRESGRASPSSVRLHERLFVEIPEDVFIHAFQFWRGERDV